jgi:hypothetical protein
MSASLRSLRLLLPRANPRVARTFATYIGHDGMTNYSPINVPTKGTPSVPVDTKMKFMGFEFPLFLESNLIIQWWQGVKLYGWQRTIVQAYTVTATLRNFPTTHTYCTYPQYCMFL